MEIVLLLGSAIIIFCVLINRLSNKIGVPMLLAFIVLGMAFGSDGIFRIHFSNYEFAEQICSIALILIIFYGGFGMKWSHAKPVAFKSIILSSVGVVLTAGFTGGFCFFALNMDLLESLLIGSVLSSTDAAAVFSVLRFKNLDLKHNTSSLLELESGSNDPCAYTLTIIALTAMSSHIGGQAIVLTFVSQLVLGALFGVIIALGAAFFLEHFKFTNEGFDAAFVLAVAVLAYTVPAMIGGNGYLSTYIVGIILGNKNIKNKKALVNFFDGFTTLAQMLVFFLLGLLSFPSKIPAIFPQSIAIALFITFVGRPLVVALLLVPTKAKLNQMIMVAWAGLRGATSIIFAIVAMTGTANMQNDVFHITFCVVLFSIAVQGTLLPYLAKKLDMIEENGNVLKTFNDYTEEVNVQFICLAVDENHPWAEIKVKDTSLLPNTLIVMIIRDHKRVIPSGDTKILIGDRVVVSAPAFAYEDDIKLSEVQIQNEKQWQGLALSEIDLPNKTLVIMIKRDNDVIIPNGQTIILENDVLILNSI